MTGRPKPTLPRGVRRVFRLAAGRPRIEAEVDDEVAFHLEMRAAELVAQGWPADAARAEAQRRFGDIQHWSTAMTTEDRERTARWQLAEWLGGFTRDVRYTVRALRLQPLFTIGVIMTLALGIGANTTMFGIVDQLLLQPPPHVADPGSVRRLYSASTSEAGAEQVDAVFSYAAFTTFRNASRSFAGLAAWSPAWRRPLGRGTEAREVFEASASASLFPALGVRPALGRFYSEQEDMPPNGSPVAVLGHELWRSDFGGDSAIMGRVVTIGGADYRVVGVAPPGFTGIGMQRVDVWTPMTTSSAASIGRVSRGVPWWESRSVEWLEIVGRLRPGVTPAAAEAELAVIYRQFLAGGTSPRSPERLARERPRIELGPVQAERGPAASANTPLTVWLLGVSVVVLIIACANVTNLLLARAARRRREIAVRLALGVGRGRLIRQLLLESLVLAAGGGLAGLFVAQWGGRFVRTVLMPGIPWGDTLTNPRVLTFTLVIVALTGVLAGLIPAVQASRPDLTVALKAGARDGGGRRGRTLTLLLVTQAALSVILLVGAGLFVRSLGNATSVPLGFEPARVLRLEASLRDAGYTREETPLLYQQLMTRMRSVPGVAAAALVTPVPFYSIISGPVRVPGRDSTPRMPGGQPLHVAVSPDYFATVGTRLLRGRAFTDADRAGSERVLIVSQTTARTLWPNEDALGRCVRLSTSDTMPCNTVVGVVEDVRWDKLQELPRLQVYTAIAQVPQSPSLLVRPARGDAASVEAIRRAVYEVAPRLTFANLVPLSSYVDRELRPWRLGASMFSAFGMLAMVIAAVGLYSMLAYTVTLRTHELGVRMALGAGANDVLRLVVGDGMRVTLAGVVIGLVGAVLLSPKLESLLYGVGGRDPMVLGGVAVTLVLVALVASLLPAMRAARADPSAALRTD